MDADTRWDEARMAGGGTYIHCECPQWGIQRGKGRDCKHVTYVRLSYGV